MPRKLLDVSDSWLARFNNVMPGAIDALTGWEHQIRTGITQEDCDINGLLESLLTQIIDLRRNIQSVRLIF